MGDFTPLGWTLGILLFIGLVFPFVLGFFITPQDVQLSGPTETLYDIVDDGFSLSVIPFTDWDDFDVNPFSWLGTTLQNKLLEILSYLSILPDFIQYFVIIMSIVAIVWSIVNLIPTVG